MAPKWGKCLGKRVRRDTGGEGGTDPPLPVHPRSLTDTLADRRWPPLPSTVLNSLSALVSFAKNPARKQQKGKGKPFSNRQKQRSFLCFEMDSRTRSENAIPARRFRVCVSLCVSERGRCSSVVLTFAPFFAESQLLCSAETQEALK